MEIILNKLIEARESLVNELTMDEQVYEALSQEDKDNRVPRVQALVNIQRAILMVENTINNEIQK